MLDRKSSSVPNFAKNLSEQLFTRQERREGNCAGSKGKKELDINRLNLIEQYVFSLHVMGAAEKNLVWKKCKDAINEAARRKELFL